MSYFWKLQKMETRRYLEIFDCCSNYFHVYHPNLLSKLTYFGFIFRLVHWIENFNMNGVFMLKWKVQLVVSNKGVVYCTITVSHGSNDNRTYEFMLLFCLRYHSTNEMARLLPVSILTGPKIIPGLQVQKPGFGYLKMVLTSKSIVDSYRLGFFFISF